MKHFFILFIFAMALLYPNLAEAYIGPGLGAGTIAVVVGFIGSIFLALFAIFWYPIKRIIKKIKGAKKVEQ